MTRIRCLADTAGEPERFRRTSLENRTGHRVKRNRKARLDQKP